jgi:hypothetical protein
MARTSLGSGLSGRVCHHRRRRLEKREGTGASLGWRLNILLPPGKQFLQGLDYPTMVVSPDGTQLVYSAERSRDFQLYLRPIDQAEL